MDALKHFPEEYARCFQPSFSLLSRCNIRYFVDDESFLKKYWRFFYIIPMAFMFIGSSMAHMVILLINEQMMDFAYLLPPFLVTVHAIYWVAILGSFQYLSSPLLETLVRRYILKQNCELQLPIASSYPFDPTAKWFIYIGVYAFQFYTMFVLVFVYSGSQLIMITLCALLGTEFTMLREDLDSINPTLQGSTDEELSRQLDEAFNRMIFVDLLFVGITTCAFRFAGEFARGPTYTINNYIAVASSMATVLYLCYYGARLSGASARIGDLAYQSQWNKANKQYKMTIFLIMIISQKPCCMTSLKYVKVSLNLFTKVISTTWSYLSLLNSVYREEVEDTTQ